MKKIKIEKTKITENKIKFQGDVSKELTYKDLLEIALDNVPQGGFAPKDIRDRNRIQEAFDNATPNIITLEDNDFDNMEKIVKESRWSSRDPELNTFLQKFEDGVYKKEEDEDKLVKK